MGEGSQKIPWNKPSSLVFAEHTVSKTATAIADSIDRLAVRVQRFPNNPKTMKRLAAGGEIVGTLMLVGSIGGCVAQTATGNLCRQANGSYLDAIGRPGSDCSPLRGAAETGELLGAIAGGGLVFASRLSRMDR